MTEQDWPPMQWFGREPFARACLANCRVDAPTGKPCAWCAEPIAADENGFLVLAIGASEGIPMPWHHECFVRTLIGSVVHQMRKCSCFGGTAECTEPADMTRRQEAREAVRLWTERQGHFYKLIAEAQDAIHTGGDDDD